MIASVTINNTALDPDRVVAESIVVTHGRGTVSDAAEPGSAELACLVPVGGMPAWTAGNTLTIGHDTGPLFTGRITDIGLTHVDTRELGMCARFRVTAMGPVAALGVRVVGDDPWPQESATQRAERILTLAGVPHTIDGAADPAVVARDVDARPALELLDELAESTGAAVFDTPTGTVVYQAISGRARPIIPFKWEDFDPAAMWADFDPAMTWDGDPPSFGDWVSPDSELPVELPPGAVEWEPAWMLTEAEVVNHARIGYGLPPDEGSDQDYAESTDEASIDAHGIRYTYIGSQLADVGDASARAAHIVTTQAAPRWAMPNITVVLDLVRDPDPDLYAAVLGLLCGDHVTVQGLPQPAPAVDWPAIVEGWTYQYWKTGSAEHERITLAVSDPLASLAVMRWDDYPSLYEWADHPGYLTWADLTDETMLEAS